MKMKAKKYAYWEPNDLEKKCLRHLDRVENWTILRSERPPESELQPWIPFRRIFFINLTQYVLILSVIFLILEKAQGVTWRDVQDDLVYGLAAVFILAALMGLYVTHLYRRSWNRRAISLRDDGELK